MKTRISLLVISVLYCGIAFSQTTEKLIVNFATDSYVLEATEQEKLLNVLRKHKSDHISSLTLKGHTDNVGTDDYNKTLSANRTKTVSAFLQQNGISSSAISTGFFGEQVPVQTNEDEQGKAHNRRVEVEFTLNDMNAETELEKKTSAVQPPIPGLERQFQFFTVNTAMPCTLTTNSGAQIRIPAYAFVDEKGKPVKGEVLLGFRDYYKPLEVMLSGIPMTYDSAGTAYNFETDGMFEIKALQGSKELSLSEDKNVDVDVPATPGSTGFNLYAMEESGAWTNIENTVPVTQLTKALSPAWQIYLNNLNTSFFIDTTPYARRFPDKRYEYLKAKGSFSADKFSTAGVDFRLRTAGKNKGDKKGIVKFSVVDRTFGSHSEIRPLAAETWVYDGNYNKHDFASVVLTNNFQSKRYFNDMRFVKKDSGNYIMELKGGNRFMRIPVHVYGAWDKKEKKGAEKFQQRKGRQDASRKKNESVYKDYTKKLSREEKKFDRVMNHEKGKALKAYRENQKRYQDELWNAMSEEERKMGKEEWLAYVDQVTKSRQVAAQNADIVFRTVSLNDMGIFNCDRIGKLINPVPVIVSWNDTEGNKLEPVRTFVMDKELNGIMSFYDNNITLDPGTSKAVIIVDEEGKLAFSTEESLKEIAFVSGEKVTIPLTKLQEQPKSEEEFGKLLGLAGK